MEHSVDEFESCSFNCPVEVTLSVIGGKWKVAILFFLLQERMRFGELQRKVGKVSQRVLTAQLRELEEDKIITRTVYPEVPPRVEYEITEFGKTLEPVILKMASWGDTFWKKVVRLRNKQLQAAAKGS